MRLAARKAFTAHFAHVLEIAMHRQPQLILELLRERTGRQAARDACDQFRSMRPAQFAVLETTAHHRSGAAMPIALRLGQYELDASFDNPRFRREESVCKCTQFDLRQRACHFSRLALHPKIASNAQSPARNPLAARAAFAFSFGMGNMSARFQAHRLNATDVHTAATAAGTRAPVTASAAIRVTTKTSMPPTKMPFEVLASTCERPPQSSHLAGHSRADQRFVTLDIPGPRQLGHACFM